LYGLQEPLLLSDVSAPKGSELHLDVFRPQEPVLFQTYLQRPELHLEVSKQQEPLLFLDVSDARMPMLAVSALMPMPSYGNKAREENATIKKPESQKIFKTNNIFSNLRNNDLHK
jgi:hypothetical protein